MRNHNASPFVSSAVDPWRGLPNDVDLSLAAFLPMPSRRRLACVSRRHRVLFRPFELDDALGETLFDFQLNVFTALSAASLGAQAKLFLFADQPVELRVNSEARLSAVKPLLVACRAWQVAVVLRVLPPYQLDLGGMDLSGMKLKGSSFRCVRLMGANLQGADLSESDFEACLGEGVDFSNSKLRGANFFKAELKRAKLAAVDARGANFSWAVLGDNTNFAGAQLQGAIFCFTKMQWASFIGACLLQAKLVYAQANHADFSGVDLSRSDCSSAMFDFANFSNSDCSNSIMTSTSFVEARLGKATLVGCVMNYAILIHSRCQGANFSGVSVFKADLRGVDLLEAVGCDKTQWQEADTTHAKIPTLCVS